MAFDFTSHLVRRGHDALALDAMGTGHGAPDLPECDFSPIPMWVADMNFAVPPCVTDAISARLAYPTFGYFSASDAYYQAISWWHETQKRTRPIPSECIGYENGVLGGLISAAEVLARPGDTILVHSPTYIGFTSALENAGFHIELSPLKKDDKGMWRMDYDDMERRLRDKPIHLAIMCSPHNPTGRVWAAGELKDAFELFKRYDCKVISDEIWSDLVLRGSTHTCATEISNDARRRTVALYAPSKTFNLAGLVGAYDVIYDPYLRDRVRAQASKSHYNSQNVLQMHALIGAYSEQGAEWLAELRQVLAANITTMLNCLQDIAGLSVSEPQGTYMLFVDCGAWCDKHGVDFDDLLRRGWAKGVGWQDGRPFHGEKSLRINVALPADDVTEACARITQDVFGVRPWL